QLIASGIPEEQVKIKTSGKDEISKEDLMSRDCNVRYIITVNALKEGWDCPFAYVLASLANKSSAVDVEQILGRILRQPHVTKHQQELLNFSYVLTSSANFIATLDKIIEGLNKSGFSEKDYRTKEMLQIESKESTTTDTGSFENLFKQATTAELKTVKEDITEVINPETVKEIATSSKAQNQLDEIISLATQTNETFENTIAQLDQDEIIPTELANTMKSYQIKELFKTEVKDLLLPAFYIKVKQGSIFNDEGSLQLLSKNLLLNEFALSQQETAIDFTQTSSEMYSIDLVEGKKDEYVPEYKKENNIVKEAFVKYISGLQPEAKINQLAGRMLKLIRKVDAIPEPELLKYITAVLNNLDSDKLAELSHNELFYANRIKAKIDQLSELFSEKQFVMLLDKGTIVCKSHFRFPKKITPIKTEKGITKNLYEQEGEMNDFEKKVINEIANLDSVVFWHRNLDRGKGFYLNGFINHYPDFIIKMKNGKIVLLETKGDDRDNSDSIKKIKLGEKWASKAGDQYRYFMVFNNSKLDGAKSVVELLDTLRAMS
ncbi:MAG: restriction endonuclease, partial [Bacteroidia bacterium]